MLVAPLLILALSSPTGTASAVGTTAAPAPAPAPSPAPMTMPPGPGPVVATVNGKEIHAADVTRTLLWQGVMGPHAIPPTPQARQAILDAMIDMMLLDEAAKAAGIKEDTKEVDSALDQVRHGAGTPENFDAVLRKTGMTLDLARELGARRNRALQLVDRKGSIGKPSEADVKAWHAQHGAELGTPEQIMVTQVDCKNAAVPPATDDDGARKNCDKIKTDLAAAKLPDDVFRKLPPGSTRGGILRKGFVPPTIADRLFSLPVGGVSDVIPAGGTLTVFYVRKHDAAVTPPLEAVHDAVVERVLDEKRAPVMSALLAELRPKAKIEHPAMPAPAPAPPAGASAPAGNSPKG